MTEPATSASAPSLERALGEHAAIFHECFGGVAAPRLFFAPGRVNLYGAHLDYNGGPVIPTSIDRGTYVAIRTRADRRVRIASTLDSFGIEFDLDQAPTERRGRWVDYPLGVLLDLVVRARGTMREQRLSGVEVMYGGNLPVGAGLSSSASICVATALALDQVWDLGLGLEERVQSALRAERGFVGVQCGIMDPYAVGFARPGHVLWLDCKDASWEHLPLDPRELAVLVADSGVKRELAASEFNLRVEQCRRAFAQLSTHLEGAEVLRDVPIEVLEEHGHELEALPRRRVEHVLAEVQRTFAAREALLAGERQRMGELMTASHQSLRDLYETSCPELDFLVETANACPGVFGARVTGAGFGGCIVALATNEARDSACRDLAVRFEERFGRTPPVAAYVGDAGPREVVV